MIVEVLVAALIVMTASLIGVVFAHKTTAQFMESRLTYLVSFSAGVFLVTAGALTLEVFHLASSLWWGGLLILVGYILAAVVQFLMPETHHHHTHDCDSKHGAAARKLIIGDSIHNVADGVVLVAAFTTSPVLGVAATVSIFIHEALQEVAEFFVLKRAGYSTLKALSINFAVSSTVLIGVGVGYFALASHELELFLLALSAGFFGHVVIHDLLPKKNEHESTLTFIKHIGLVCLGIILMAMVAVAIHDSHEHDDREEDTAETSISNEELIPTETHATENGGNLGKELQSGADNGNGGGSGGR